MSIGLLSDFLFCSVHVHELLSSVCIKFQFLVRFCRLSVDYVDLCGLGNILRIHAEVTGVFRGRSRR